MRHGAARGLAGARPRPELAGHGVEIWPRRLWVAGRPRRWDQPAAFPAAAPRHERHRCPAQNMENLSSMRNVNRAASAATLHEPQMPCMLNTRVVIASECLQMLLDARCLNCRQNATALRKGYRGLAQGHASGPAKLLPRTSAVMQH